MSSLATDTLDFINYILIRTLKSILVGVAYVCCMYTCKGLIL